MIGPDWNSIHARMHTRVRFIARSVLRDEHEVEDAVQDTFLRAVRSIGSLREPAALPGWLLLIARRAALDRCRKLRPVVQVAEDSPEPEAGRDGFRFSAIEVAEAMARLPAWAQRALNCRASGWTIEQIAAEEGISVPAVKTRLHRARARIRRVLS